MTARSLKDYEPLTTDGRYGRCKRCGTPMEGMRGIVSARLFRKPDGRGKGQEAIGSCAATLCESCALDVWEVVETAVRERIA